MSLKRKEFIKESQKIWWVAQPFSDKQTSKQTNKQTSGNLFLSSQIRLSVGLEEVKDLIEDLYNALKVAVSQ